MRRQLAACMLLVISLAAGSDPLLCPDGCTDESGQQTSRPAPAHADCLACRNAISTALPTFDLTPDGFTETGDQDLPQQIADPTPFSIDHPPRTT